MVNPADHWPVTRLKGGAVAIDVVCRECGRTRVFMGPTLADAYALRTSEGWVTVSDKDGLRDYCPSCRAKAPRPAAGPLPLVGGKYNQTAAQAQEQVEEFIGWATMAAVFVAGCLVGWLVG